MIDRRTFCGALPSLALSQAVPAMAATRQKRPNILLIIADDWGWPSSRAEDPFGIRMPTWDRIRREGVNFENAFVAQPSCTPSRAAILTGRAPYQLEEGAYLSGTLPAKFDVYPDLLEARGYQVGFTGKGWAPGHVTAGGRTRNPAGPEFPDFGAFLETRRKGMPFCFWFGSQNPHRPFEEGEGHRSGITIPAGRIPPYLPDVPVVRSDVADYVARVQRFDAEAAALLAALEANGEIENTLVVMTGDNGWAFPRSKATLYDSGVHVPLAMMWPGRLPRGVNSKTFVSLIDLCPTFLEAAGVEMPPALTGKSLLPHLTARAAHRDYVVASLERHNDGREVSGLGYPARSLRNNKWLYVRNLEPERWPAGKPRIYDPKSLTKYSLAGYADIDYSPTKEFIILERGKPEVWPYFEMAMGKRPSRQLYDVAADPFNMRNLAIDPDHQSVVEELDSLLLAELRQTRDPRIVGGGEFFDRVPPFVKHDPASRFSRPLDY
jgi:N-sulfoglucosamine sulfohydrolase